MPAQRPSWFRRAFIAFSSVRRILKDPGFAGAVATLATGASAPAAAPRPAPVPLEKAPPDSALLLLGLLQKEGRLVDFLQEDIRGASDAEVGAAARIVHQGCRRVLEQHLQISPVCEAAEGSRLTLERGFDAAAFRPTGNVVGDPPFTGTLVHRGWRVVQMRLPEVASTHDLDVLAAAEVEL